MRIRRTVVQTSITWALALSLMFLATGCIISGPSCTRREAREQSLSLKGTGHQFGRGVTNVAFCWLELPSEIGEHVRDYGPGNPFGILPTALGITFGTVSGSFRAVERAVGGVFEIGLSPFPPYEPLMHPAFPPYAESIKAPCEEGCSCSRCARAREKAGCDMHE